MYIVANRSFKTWEEATKQCNFCDFDYNMIVTETKQQTEQIKKIYWYEYRLRGFSPGCQPKGWIDLDHNKGKFGQIAYDRPLTEQEIYDYELREVN